MINNGVIVLGGHIQALGITRILGKLGIPIIILDSNPYNLARHSKFCKQFFRFNENNLLDKLLELGKLIQYQNFTIFPTNDSHVGILSKNKEELSKYFLIATDDWPIIEKCYNKRITYNIAEKLNIPIPKTYTPNSLNELNDLELNYPVIIKPAVMHSFYSKLKKKVFVCSNKNELNTFYKLSISVIPAEEIIVQSIIPGNSEHLYSACFLFNKNEEILSFVGRRARQHPPDFGNATTFAQIVDNDELLNTSRKLLKEINYKGMCEVEFKFDPTSQKYILLEINPRTWKWHSISEKAGVNMLENYFLLLTNQALNPSKIIRKASFKHFTTDFPTTLKYLFSGIYKSYPKYPLQHAVWAANDPLPAFFELIYLPHLILKR